MCLEMITILQMAREKQVNVTIAFASNRQACFGDGASVTTRT